VLRGKQYNNVHKDKESELDLGRKDLVLMHEGQCSKERSGLELVSKEEWQGDKQIGGTAAEPYLEQNKDNLPETGLKILQNRSRNSSRTGAETCSGTGSRNRSWNCFRGRRARSEPNRGNSC